jgi:hypothetical protein
MKKLFCLLLSVSLIVSTITLFGCKKNHLVNHVSEFRSQIYQGETDGEQKISVKCAYGFIEQPYVLDGKTGEIIYRLKFKISGDLDSNVSYSIAFTHDGFNYKKEFQHSKINNSYTASFEINDFELLEFDVNIFVGAKSSTAKLKSIVPSGVLSCEQVLNKLEELQPNLIKEKTGEDGTFNAEIYMRILVKNEYPYYYIGVSHQNKIKAFLMDAKTGKILAVRDVF